MQLGWPLPKRKELINKLTKSSRTLELKFQGKLSPYYVYRVPIDLPKYRLANGRTQAMQEEYLATHQVPADFFSGDEELATAQKVQHSLLKEVVNLEGLFGYFKTNAQEEPLILTATGFVVNGNRRLCAMRELLESSSKKFRRFENIDVVFLPPCNDKDIDSLEADLQIKEDIKADYSWITQACMLRRRRNRPYNDVELARMYDMHPADVREAIALLGEADEYLTAIGKPKQYHLVEKHEFAFKKLKEGRAKMKNEGERAIFTAIVYRLIERPEALSGRLYKNIPDVAKSLPRLIPRLAVEFPAKSNGGSKPKGDLALLGGGAPQIGALVANVSAPANRDRVLTITRDMVEASRSQQREKASAEFPLERLKDAHTAVLDAVNALGYKTKRDGLAAQLDSIETAVRKIRDWLKKDA